MDSYIIFIFFFLASGTTNAEDAAALCATGDYMFVPKSDDCNAFYMCSNGAAYLMHCAAGTVFSRAQHVCVHEYDTELNDCVLEEDDSPNRTLAYLFVSFSIFNFELSILHIEEQHIKCNQLLSLDFGKVARKFCF